MRLRTHSPPSAVVLAAVVLLMAACGEDPLGPTDAETVVVSPPAAELAALQETAQLTAEALDPGDRSIPGVTFTWTSADPGVVTVDGAGVARAVAPGMTEVRATVEGGTASGTATVTVNQVAVEVTISGIPDSLLVGETIQLELDPRDANGFSLVDPEISWSSGDPEVATVDSEGRVTGEERGEVEIRAEVTGTQGAAELSVVRPFLAPEGDMELSGHVKVRDLQVGEGVTVTAASDLLLDVEGDAVVAGTLGGDCVQVEVRSTGNLRVTGEVSNECPADGVSSGAGAFLRLEDEEEEPGLFFRVGGEIEIHGAEIASTGEILISNDPEAEAGLPTGPAPGTGEHDCDLQGVIRGGAGTEESDEPSRRGADGSPRGEDGRDAPALSVFCLEDLVIRSSLIRGAFGGQGGDGLGGTFSEPARGGKGGDGGQVTLAARGAVVLVGETTIWSGWGGSGGRAEDDPRGEGVARQAHAVGGEGGRSPVPRVFGSPIDLRGGTLRVRIFSGWGGRARAFALDGQDATASAAATPGQWASAEGGRGGDVGHPEGGAQQVIDGLLVGQVLGASNVFLLLPEFVIGGQGGSAITRAGGGGSGSAQFPDGAAGGGQFAVGGEGGTSYLRDNRSGAGSWFPSGPGGIVQLAGGVGGAGYDGCQDDPQGPGGDGGPGGPATGLAGQGGAAGQDRARTGWVILFRVANGGRAGDGSEPGQGGSAGASGLVGSPIVENDPPNFQDGEDGDPCAEETGIALDTDQVSAEHTIGESTCPQTVGTVGIMNTGQTEVTVTAHVPAGLTISGVAGIELAPGETGEATLVFDCSHLVSIFTSILWVATATDGSGSDEATLQVEMRVFGPAVLLDHNVGPFQAGEYIGLFRVEHGLVSGPDQGCPATPDHDGFHLHGAYPPTPPDGPGHIFVDGQGPRADPNPPGCGYGRIYVVLLLPPGGGVGDAMPAPRPPRAGRRP